MVNAYTIRRELKFFFSLNNVQFQWTMVALTALLSLVTITMSRALPFFMEFPINVFLAFVVFQFGQASLFMPIPEPYLVKLFEDAKRAIWYATAPGWFEVPNQQIIRYVTVDFAEVYGADGVLQGHIQDEWDDDNWIFTPMKEGEFCRMPWIAYRRTKKH